MTENENWTKFKEILDQTLDNRFKDLQSIQKKDLELALKELKLSNLEPTTATTGPSGKDQGHKTLEEQLSCPECYQKIRKAVMKKELEGADYKCVDCGLPVRGEESEKEAWSCPSCNGKYAKPRK